MVCQVSRLRYKVRWFRINRILGKAGIPVVYMTWEPNRVLTSRWDVGAYTHGRFYTKEEMWENFKYFLDRALPVCEEAQVKIALHPNDPPVDHVPVWTEQGGGTKASFAYCTGYMKALLHCAMAELHGEKQEA